MAEDKYVPLEDAEDGDKVGPGLIFRGRFGSAEEAIAAAQEREKDQ